MFKTKRLLAIISFIAFLSGCAKITPLSREILLMDTFVRLEIRDNLNRDLKTAAVEKAVERMKELEKRFNYFREDSELARINNLKKGEKFLLSEEMFEVLKVSRDLNLRTRGVFDVTVGALLEIWFSRSNGNNLPKEEEIKAAKEKVGLNNWTLDEKEKTLSIKKGGVKINLGGIAKGFIVDEGIKVLKDSGVNNALINAGGDMYCMGDGASDGGWKIGLSDPRNSRRVIATFKVRNKGVATSGGYERFKEFGKDKYTHIIDPRTGYPIKKILKSVTVVANDCMTADVLATALYVLDIQGGLSIIEDTNDTECIIIDEDGRFFVSSGLQGRVMELTKV